MSQRTTRGEQIKRPARRLDAPNNLGGATMSQSVLRSIFRSIPECAFVLCASALWAASASALSFSLGGVNGQDVTPGDQVSVTVSIATEATTGITLFSVAVVFDETRLAYNLGASSNSSYLFFPPGRGATFFRAGPSCGGSAFPLFQHGTGCGELGPPFNGQVNIDYANSSLVNGSTSYGTNQNNGVALVATLVFDVLGNSVGSAAITISQTAAGNFIQMAGGGSTVAGLSGSGSVNVIPEPTTALLVALGLAGLGIARRRRGTTMIRPALGKNCVLFSTLLVLA